MEAVKTIKPEFMTASDSAEVVDVHGFIKCEYDAFLQMAMSLACGWAHIMQRILNK